MSLTVGRIYGIPIQIDYSWFIIFLLIAWTVGFDLMPINYPGLGFLDELVIGVVSSLALFASVLIHELAHSVVAKRSGMKITRITLFLFGGVSEIADEPSTANLELKMALAGPLTSLALAGVLNAAWFLSVFVNASVLIQAPLQYIAWVNEVVAAFNLIPAFPMDGGRVLRSLIWRRNGDLLASTRSAASVGRAISYVIMGIGAFFLIFLLEIFTGLWLLLIGWFIASGARSSLSQLIIEEGMKKSTAREMMSSKVDVVQPNLTLSDLHDMIIRQGHNGYPVIEDGQLVGCVTIDDFRKVKKEEWGNVFVKDVMTPRSEVPTVGMDESGQVVVHLMNSSRLGRVIVVDSQGKLAGIITRSDVLRMMQMREAAAIETVAVHSSRQKIMSVNSGMYFELQEQLMQGYDWVAEFDPNFFQLARSWVDAGVQGVMIKKFNFLAMRPGTSTITLHQIAQPTPSRPATRGGIYVRYTISIIGPASQIANQ
ncbi:MAG: site-2 protease family protein [Nitrososphaerota archaeon]|jgi:Zn-dependent protease|nr:site-2 protease family protein [Nitrososphaerota archaeon]